MKRTILVILMASGTALVALLSAGCVDCNDDGTIDSIGDLCPNPEPGKPVLPETVFSPRPSV